MEIIDVPIPWWAWPGFGVGVALLLLVDIVVHRGTRLRSRRAAVVFTIGWILVGLAFTLVVWGVVGAEHAQEYLAAYLVEKSLSLDNLFVFLVIFRSVGIPFQNQRAVLTLGIFGALVFRLVFVFLGVAVLERYHAVVYVFALLLVVAAVRALRADPVEQKESRLVRFLARHLPVTAKLENNAYFVKRNGKRLATPLFVALVAVELTDVVFAIDSVPAALAISQNVFIVFSSNALAMLGMRSLFIIVEQAIGKLHFLRFGLAAVLFFAAVKILAARFVDIPPIVSVLIIVACIAASIIASYVWQRHRIPEAPVAESDA